MISIFAKGGQHGGYGVATGWLRGGYGVAYGVAYRVLAGRSVHPLIPCSDSLSHDLSTIPDCLDCNRRQVDWLSVGLSSVPSRRTPVGSADYSDLLINRYGKSISGSTNS